MSSSCCATTRSSTPSPPSPGAAGAARVDGPEAEPVDRVMVSSSCALTEPGDGREGVGRNSSGGSDSQPRGQQIEAVDVLEKLAEGDPGTKGLLDGGADLGQEKGIEAQLEEGRRGIQIRRGRFRTVRRRGSAAGATAPPFDPRLEVERGNVARWKVVTIQPREVHRGPRRRPAVAPGPGQPIAFAFERVGRQRDAPTLLPWSAVQSSWDPPIQRRPAAASTPSISSRDPAGTERGRQRCVRLDRSGC